MLLYTVYILYVYLEVCFMYCSLQLLLNLLLPKNSDLLYL